MPFRRYCAFSIKVIHKYRLLIDLRRLLQNLHCWKGAGKKMIESTLGDGSGNDTYSFK